MDKKVSGYMEKELIANICEELVKYCVSEIPQIENNELIWILNGSVLCNILYNVNYIDDIRVSDEMKSYCYDYIRVPKGDIDITYKADRRYKFNLNSKQVLDFKAISRENRDYNFVDSNSEINSQDLMQICKMQTKSGFVFYAKKPNYIFIYKLREFLNLYHKEILNNDIKTINKKNKNIIHDLKALYNIAYSYCHNFNYLIDNIYMISSFLNNLRNSDIEKYNNLIDQGINIIKSKHISNVLK